MNAPGGVVMKTRDSGAGLSFSGNCGATQNQAVPGDRNRIGKFVYWKQSLLFLT